MVGLRQSMGRRQHARELAVCPEIRHSCGLAPRRGFASRRGLAPCRELAHSREISPCCETGFCLESALWREIVRRGVIRASPRRHGATVYCAWVFRHRLGGSLSAGLRGSPRPSAANRRWTHGRARLTPRARPSTHDRCEPSPSPSPPSLASGAFRSHRAPPARSSPFRFCPRSPTSAPGRCSGTR